MDAGKIAEALAQWRLSLDSRPAWQNPGAQYRYLVRYADKLAACNAIDPLERFDMVEMALAAFGHFVEEEPQEWRHPASEYDVYNDAGSQVGILRGSRYFLHGKTVRPDPMESSHRSRRKTASPCSLPAPMRPMACCAIATSSPTPGNV